MIYIYSKRKAMAKPHNKNKHGIIMVTLSLYFYARHLLFIFVCPSFLTLMPPYFPSPPQDVCWWVCVLMEWLLAAGSLWLWPWRLDRVKKRVKLISTACFTPLSYPNNTTSSFRFLNVQQHLIYPHSIFILQHPS